MSVLQIGKHKVRHGNVYETNAIEQFLGGIRADIFYSDPPWGGGNLKYWNTMNKKMNGAEAKEYDYGFDVDKFLKVILSSAKRFTNGWVAIEYGQRWTKKAITMGQQVGLHFCNQVEATYSGGRPVDIIVFRTDKVLPINLDSVYHLSGYKCVKEMFRLLKSSTDCVGMDLCCGMGYTAQACVDNGMTFIGNELNITRLIKTINRLEKDKIK